MPKPMGPKKRKKIALKKEKKRAREQAALKQLQDRQSAVDAKLAEESAVLGRQRVVRPERNPKRPNRFAGESAPPIPPPQLLDAIHEFLLDYRYIKAAHGMRTDNQKREGHAQAVWKWTSKGLPFLSDIFLQWKEQNPETVEQGAVERKRALAERERWKAETNEAKRQKKELKRKRRDLALEAAQAEVEKDFSAVTDAKKRLRKAEREQLRLDGREVEESEDQGDVDGEVTESKERKATGAKERDGSDSGSSSDNESDTSSSSDSSRSDDEEPAKTAHERPASNEAKTNTAKPATSIQPAAGQKRRATQMESASSSSSSSSSSSTDSESEAHVPAKTNSLPPDNPAELTKEPSNASDGATSGSSNTVTGEPTPKKTKRAEVAEVSKSGPGKKADKENFSRVPKDQKVEDRFNSNAYVPYDYAERAHQDLSVVKGKNFTKEKNKKKRGQKFTGGTIDINDNRAIKFDD